MLRVRIFSTEAETWRDAARRLRRVEFVGVAEGGPSSAGVDAEIAVLDGPVDAEPTAIEGLLAGGRHVLIVAPPCLPVEALDRLATQARAAKRRIAFLNPDRMLPSRQLIRSQLGAALGSPELVRIHRRRTHELGETLSPLGVPSGLVGEIEQAMWLVGRPLARVFAVEPRVAEADTPGRCLLVHLAFEVGMATIDYDDRLPAGNFAAGASYRFLSVIGSSGSAQIDDQRNSQLVYLGGAPRGLPVDEGVRHLATLVDDFAAACEEGKEFADGVAAWTDVARAVAAVERSLKTRDVAIPEKA